MHTGYRGGIRVESGINIKNKIKISCNISGE